VLLDAPHMPLRVAELPLPKPGPGQVLLRVGACGVCLTDLHIADGELSHPKLPLVLGHEIAGVVAGTGTGVGQFAVGQRVGVPWLGWTCGACRFCRSGRENLCDRARFTGYQIDSGYAEYAVADARFCFSLPDGFSDVEAAPLLCAGMIGYRAVVAASDAARLGMYGFGAAAHIVAQVARHQGRQVFAFTRAGDLGMERSSWRSLPSCRSGSRPSRSCSTMPTKHSASYTPERCMERPCWWQQRGISVKCHGGDAG
jgi:alcohol dehydrogenase, propanol-preferring